MATVPANDLLTAVRKPKTVATDITDRLSQELVIALVGPVGSGVSTAASFIEEILKNQYHYTVAPIIKASDVIRSEAHRVQMSAPPKVPFDEYVSKMQDAGNRLRERFGGDYLTEKMVEKICEFRSANGGYQGQIQIPGRRAYVIDSLKNIEEIDLLRKIYGETLCVVGVFAPDEIRRKRLENIGVPDTRIDRIMDRDQGELATFGQNTRKLFVRSDFFVCNDQIEKELRSKLSRFFGLIFNTEVHTPTRAESAMYEANAAAANSACMSRQVGAAIVSDRNELISVGWNDVPKFGGSLYTDDDRSVFNHTSGSVTDQDHRCYNWGGNICHNETRRNNILDDICSRIANSNVIKRGTSKFAVLQILLGTEVDSLTEFSRSIHAEMEAILSVAREGRHSLLGATLYTNTYPCHNCARHIVASGIVTVIYIEPYLKSLATTLHRDVITEDPSAVGKVIFRQYDGVAPVSYLRLFRPHADRKLQGKLHRPPASTALPIFRIALDAQTDYEDKVVADLSQKEQA